MKPMLVSHLFDNEVDPVVLNPREIVWIKYHTSDPSERSVIKLTDGSILIVKGCCSEISTTWSECLQ